MPILTEWIYRFPMFFSRRLYIAVISIVVVFILAFFYDPLLLMGKLLLLCLFIALFIDGIAVFISRQPLTAERRCADRFSNGDENAVNLVFNNHQPYKIIVLVIEEVPYQFQHVNHQFTVQLPPSASFITSYQVRPTERGEYRFGIINILLYSPLRLVIRHLRLGTEKTVAVYPSFVQMKRYQLMSVTSRVSEKGSRPLRKLGSSLEFEQIKEYVSGDDYRSINWQATARKNALMLNTFMDERSQQVVCIIDKGRNMKMSFAGMTLLDYAINSALVLSNLVMQKQDKAGLLTYGKKVDQFVRPDKQSNHIALLLEALYRQQTNFTDSDTEALYTAIRQHIRQRSLLILFTNFESRYGLERQLPFLKKIASYHALLVVFFENNGLTDLQNTPAVTVGDVYEKVIAKKFIHEKRQMVKELQNAGIMALLTAPQKLTVNVINKYMEAKARQVV